MLSETLEYIGIAFISSALLIVLSKIILQSLIRRPADYYVAEELRQEELMLNAGGLSIFNEHETSPEGDTIESSHLEPHIPMSAEPGEIEERSKIGKIHDAGEEQPDRKWDESYKDIRKSLEEAFAKEHPEEPAEPEPETDVKPKPQIPLTKAGKPRKPSMNMKKDELTAIAESMGIEIPAKATKAVILELINGQKQGE